MSRVLDIEKDPQSFISPIVGVFDEKYNLSLHEAVKHSQNIVPYGESLLKSCLFFATNLNNNMESLRLSIDEVAAINLYTLESDYYKELNQRLRDRDRKQLVPFFPYLRILLTGLNKIPPYYGKIWRGVKMDLVSKYPKGKKFFWWSFSSCTVDIEVLERGHFCGKTGVRTIFCVNTERGRSLKDFSTFSDEGEVILMPGYYMVKGIMSAGNDLNIIDIEELPPPFDIIIGMEVSKPIPPEVITSPIQTKEAITPIVSKPIPPKVIAKTIPSKVTVKTAPPKVTATPFYTEFKWRNDFSCVQCVSKKKKKKIFSSHLNVECMFSHHYVVFLF